MSPVGTLLPGPAIVLVMGVAGAGKTTVGRALAAALGAQFYDADDLHSSENVARMRAGLPLGDAERAPWLAAVGALVARLARDGANAVVACSALRRAYRAVVVPPAAAPSTRLVYLRLPPEVARARVAARATRSQHFMPAALVDSQFATLEAPSPRDALVVDATMPVAAIVAAVRAALGR